MISLGQKVRFDPFADQICSFSRLSLPTVGTVVYINAPHKWFSVQYCENQRISFKFSDIGKAVKLCK